VISGSIPAAGLNVGMGKVGEKLEGLESYLWVVLEHEEVVRGGGSTAGGGRRRYCAAVAAFQRGVEVMAGPGSFVETRANGFGGWWGSALARAAARRGWVAMAMAGMAAWPFQWRWGQAAAVWRGVSTSMAGRCRRA